MTAPIRLELPAWPRLMSETFAAAYVGLSATTLRKDGPKPKRHGRRVLYDIRDLDRWADHLDGQPLDETQELDEASQIEARFLERRNARG